MAYFGEYFFTVDGANRLTVPARFREDVGGDIILFRSPDGCLFLYDLRRFEEIRKNVDALSGTPGGREMIRNFYADVAEVSVDRTGRFMIPADYMSFADLKTDVVILGVGDRMELWDKEIYLAKYGDRASVPMDRYPSIVY